MEILSLLKNILCYSESEAEIIRLINLSSTENKSVIQELFQALNSVFLEPEKPSFSRLQSVRVIKSLMSLGKSSIVCFTESYFIPVIQAYILNKQPWGGFHIWFALLSTSDNFEFKAFILLLQCIEKWAKLYPIDQNGNQSQFLTCLQNLKDKNIEFPPTFFLKPADKEFAIISKKNGKRVKSLCDEFRKQLSYTNKNKCVYLKKILKSYEKYVKLAVSHEADKKINIKLLQEIMQITNLFDKWKSNQYSKIPEDQDLKIFKLVEDPEPKVLPSRVDCDNDSWSNQEEKMSPSKIKHKRSCTGNCSSVTDKILKYKEKIKKLKEAQDGFSHQITIFQESNTIVFEDNKNLKKFNKELKSLLLDSESKCRELNELQKTNTIELRKKEKELKKLSDQKDKLKTNLSNLEKLFYSVQGENEKNKIILKKLEFENNFSESFQSFSKSVLSKIRKNKVVGKPSKIPYEHDETVISQLRSPNLCFVTPIDLMTHSDSESEKLSSIEHTEINVPNYSVNMQRNFFLNPMPSKSSSISRPIISIPI